MLAALAFLMAGGACLGLSFVPFERQEAEYRYVSLGILGPDEPVDAFDVVSAELDPGMHAYEERNARRMAMTERLDPLTVVHAVDRGGVYLETVAGGRRRFNLNGQELQNLPSPLRWFLVPSLMFLIAGPASFLIALRWS